MSIKKILKEKSVLNLDISTGVPLQKGFFTLEDVGGDFSLLPFPLPSQSVDFIKCAGIIEKIPRENKKFIKFMDECWRVLKYDAQMAIATAYAGSYAYYQDPLNINPCNESTFAYFDPLERITGGDHYKVYRPRPWRIVAMAFSQTGLIEVVLEKRREDVSYG